ncbi:hypothetical protein SOV_27320 [Sporomusa ovata DSM 2662]|uniref:Uncharacterized protein n=1 Tax=Sporomusa ovata TaxID=2378 RepID=A0A0U1L651_9FIRM|nr:hypothetical protein [Sporomusa ovata]EQB26047.1 hypothetical protein SOV_4c07140 [Sporomusa ovata DSM 2662]CQR74623.1 hypothetical protein SpAn4DRAFT_1085 [Sporomusa ovata]
MTSEKNQEKDKNTKPANQPTQQEEEATQAVEIQNILSSLP